MNFLRRIPGQLYNRLADTKILSMMSTIRGRIIIVFIACLTFVGILTTIYCWNIITFKQKLTLIENYEDISNSILELRRYEKNLIYAKDMESIKEIGFYLDKIQAGTAKMSENIAEVMGREELDRFNALLISYKNDIESDDYHSRVDIQQIRTKGKSMVDFAQTLLERKRKRIEQALRHILYIPFVFLGGFVPLITLVFLMETRSVLGRLALIRNATEDVARGKFTSIPDHAKWNDEVSNLIVAFNKMQAELDARQEQLVQSRKMASIGTFTSGIAHELNNPLNNVSLTADCLLEEYNSLSEAEAKEMILDVINQTARASEVVKNLLDFSRQNRPSFTELQIADIIDVTARLIRNQFMLSEVKLVRKIPENLPTIRGNIHNLKQVFINLFLNSIQAMPDGGTIVIEATEEPDQHIRVDVSDTGTGISPRDLERIFDPFYTTKPVGRGTGLGLSIVYSEVERHGGHVEARSELNVGTTFSIFFPVLQSSSLETETTGFLNGNARSSN